MKIRIRGGLVIDPSTETVAVRDVVIDGDLIGSGHGDTAELEIDAAGMIVVPGFIDIHTHTDFTLPALPSAEVRLRQGITTDVTGNCGFSPFPLEPSWARFGSFFDGGHMPHRFPSLRAFADFLQDQGPAINVAPLVGHGAIRHSVLGESTAPATRAERLEMARLLDANLSMGAFGASIGLVYEPGRFVGADELAATLAPLGERELLLAAHVRDERDGLVASVAEVLEIARSVDCRLQVSHHKAVGRHNWGMTVRTLAMMEAAIKEGVDVAFDYYPFTSGSTGLSSLLPIGAVDGGWERFRTRCHDEAYRLDVQRHIEGSAQFRLDEIRLGTCRTHAEYSGERLVEIASREGTNASALALELMLAEGDSMTIIVEAASEQDLRLVSAHRLASHGSDSWVLDPYQAQFEHPRNRTSATMVLASGLRGDLPLLDAVAQLTSRPASRLRLNGRGSLAPGSWADVAVFNPYALLHEQSSAPESSSSVVEWLFVNGKSAIERGAVTGAQSGRVLRTDD